MFRVRYRHIFILVGGAATTAILALTSALNHAPRPSGARIPSSTQEAPISHISPSEEPAICKHLYKIVCHGQGHDQAQRDPTGLVRPDVEGERIVTSMYKDIIEKNPDWTEEQVDDELARQIFTPVRRGRLEAAYHWVQNRIEQIIESQPEHVFTAHEKKVLRQRIHNTTLEIPPPASIYADEPELLTKNDVFYERTTDGTTRMRVGGAYLFTAKSWFNMVFTMGHELGHSIDPCEIRNARLSFPAYDRLEACFQKTGIVATSKNRAECENNDQLSEAFADWIGTQVVSDALRIFSAEFHGTQLVNAASNSVRDLCEQDDANDLDTSDHPPPVVRIEKIFGNQPGIRSVLGCSVPVPSQSQYCGFDSDVTLMKKDSI
jgi:hypothetical protein